MQSGQMGDLRTKASVRPPTLGEVDRLPMRLKTSEGERVRLRERQSRKGGLRERDFSVHMII